MKTPPLSSQQIRALRGLGHHLEVLSMIGKEGITPNLVTAVGDNLVAHELVKVRVQDTCPLERGEAASQLAAALAAAVVQILGKTALLYRPNPDLDDERRIVL
ncbi:MAG: YhbY family RNA-binding protein [Desulfobacteraceae bacterium]|nr:YhbY family RNA-binding protein [Desulfobacteraceae bacterium]